MIALTWVVFAALALLWTGGAAMAAGLAGWTAQALADGSAAGAAREIAAIPVPQWMALWLDIKVVLGFSDAHAIPALAYSWRIMRPFLGVAGLLSLWLVSFAIVRRHLYLTKWRVLNQPPALLRKDEIARSGLSPELAAQLQERRMSVVRFDAQGLVGHLDAD